MNSNLPKVQLLSNLSAKKIMNEYEVTEIKTWTGMGWNCPNWAGGDNATDFSHTYRQEFTLYEEANSFL